MPSETRPQKRYGNATEAAAILGFSSSHFHRLTTAGKLPRFPVGQIPLDEIQGIYDEYRAKASPSGRRPSVETTEEGKARQSERERLTAAQANLKELEYQVKAGNLVESSYLQQAWAQAGATIRERILQAGERIITRLGPYMTDPRPLDLIVQGEIEDALKSISQEPPSHA